MRETTSSSGAASSSGSLNGCTPRQMPLASSRIWWNSAFGTVGTKDTPSTSSRASTIAQPDFDIVVGSSNFLRLVAAVCAIGVSLSFRERSSEAGQFLDRRDIGAVPGRAQHDLVHDEAL